MNSRKIVFINQATGYLTIDIINEFAKEFDEVALIAGSVRVQDAPLDPKIVRKHIVKYNRGNPLKKATSWLWGTLQIYFLLRFRYHRYEIFYITVPPTAYLLSLVLPNKFSVQIADIYPDALKIFGIGEKNPLYRSWQKWNIKLFKRAHRIYTLGDAMKKVLSSYISPDKITVINNWSGLQNLLPVSKEKNPFIQQHGLNGKFIVAYSGNIGHTHNVETLLSVAQKLRDETSIHFIIVGRGNRYQVIGQQIKEQVLTNCLLLPFQPDEMIHYSLSAADLSVVILDDRVAGNSIPSKTYNLLTVGSPIMVIGSDEAELASFVRKNELGRSFKQDLEKDMVDFILELKSDVSLLALYRQNSLNASKNFTSLNARKYLEHYLEE